MAKGSVAEQNTYTSYCNSGPHYWNATVGGSAEPANTALTDGLMLNLEDYMFAKDGVGFPNQELACGLKVKGAAGVWSADPFKKYQDTYSPSERAENCKESKFCTGKIFSAANTAVYDTGAQWSDAISLKMRKLSRSATQLMCASPAGAGGMEDDFWVYMQRDPRICEWANRNTTDYDYFFDHVYRDCAKAAGHGGLPYVMNVGSRFSRQEDGSPTGNPLLGRWMSPIRFNRDLVTRLDSVKTQGYSCGCRRPSNDDLQSRIYDSEICVCGDFADQPSYDEPNIGLNTNTMWMAVYNFIMCNMYLTAEQMCFPSIPFEVSGFQEVDWDVQLWMQRHGVHYYCAGGSEAETSASAYSVSQAKCKDDSDIRVDLQCAAAGFEPGVFNPTTRSKIPFIWRHSGDSDYKVPSDIVAKRVGHMSWAFYSQVNNAYQSVRYMLRWVGHVNKLTWTFASGWKRVMDTFPISWVLAIPELWPLQFDLEVDTLWFYPPCSSTGMHFARCWDKDTAEADRQDRPSCRCFDLNNWDGSTRPELPECKGPDTAFAYSEGLYDEIKALPDNWPGYTCSPTHVCRADRPWGSCGVKNEVQGSEGRYNMEGGTVEAAARSGEPLPIPGPATLCFFVSSGSLLAIAAVFLFVSVVFSSFKDFLLSFFTIAGLSFLAAAMTFDRGVFYWGGGAAVVVVFCTVRRQPAPLFYLTERLDKIGGSLMSKIRTNKVFSANVDYFKNSVNFISAARGESGLSGPIRAVYRRTRGAMAYLIGKRAPAAAEARPAATTPARDDHYGVVKPPSTAPGGRFTL